MNPKTNGASSQYTPTHLVCPTCGGPVIAKIAFGSNFCGVRTLAECRKGCTWTPQEQQAMNNAASDEMFG
jgi:ssDNA-binding Zn-finger/Zn-ribbon topoisomerase 1